MTVETLNEVYRNLMRDGAKCADESSWPSSILYPILGARRWVLRRPDGKKLYFRSF